MHNVPLPSPDTFADLLLTLTALSGEFPSALVRRLPGSEYYNRNAVTRMKKAGLLYKYSRDGLHGLRLTSAAKAVLRGLRKYAAYAARKPHGQHATVYVLTNYDTTMEENLYRIYTLRDMDFDPYVMVYDKPNAPREIRDLQRWCNNRLIYKSVPDFYKYDPKRR